MKKQVAKKRRNKINTYFIENHIIIKKFWVISILSSRDIVIQIINIKKVEKLKKKTIRQKSWQIKLN